jgi:hypothetical protein
MRTPFVLAVLLAAAFAQPAAAGACVQQKDGAHCSDGGQTVILKGPSGSFGKIGGEKFMVQQDGAGNTFGLIGGEKFVIHRSNGLSVAKFGDKKLICTDAGGVTICK